MEISGFEKLTLTDYPGHIACILFTKGCNFKCPFCHNSDLITFGKGNISQTDVMDYLKKRKSMLDGVVITGGEPTMQKDIMSFIKSIKDLGLKVKLDTNGYNPIVLKGLIDEKLIDYIAMDIKADEVNYSLVSGININYNKIIESVDYIKKSGIDYEFRTTVVKEYHNYEILNSICEYLGKNTKYYIQNFENSSNVLNQKLNGFDKRELIELVNKLNKRFPNVMIRGI